MSCLQSIHLQGRLRWSHSLGYRIPAVALTSDDNGSYRTRWETTSPDVSFCCFETIVPNTLKAITTPWPLWVFLWAQNITFHSWHHTGFVRAPILAPLWSWSSNSHLSDAIEFLLLELSRLLNSFKAGLMRVLQLSPYPSKPGTASGCSVTLATASQQIWKTDQNISLSMGGRSPAQQVWVGWSYMRAAFPTHLGSTDTQGARLLRFFWKKARKWPGVSGRPVSRVVASGLQLQYGIRDHSNTCLLASM